MARIKSFTDLSQSKVIAEILPHETADMYYTPPLIKGHTDYIPHLKRKLPIDWDIEQAIPCWSLAALLNVLPPYLFEFERGIDLNVYPNLNGKGWHCSYMPNCIENMEKDKFKLITSEDSLVDACVAMIIKLHEQKLL